MLVLGTPWIMSQITYLSYDCGTAVLPDTVSKMIAVASELPRCLLAATLIDAVTKQLRWAGKTLNWLLPLCRYNLNNKHVQIWEKKSSVEIQRHYDVDVYVNQISYAELLKAIQATGFDLVTEEPL